MEKQNCQRIRVWTVAKILGCSKSTVWAWVKKGFLPPPRKVGTRFSYWLRNEIEAIALGEDTVNSPQVKDTIGHTQKIVFHPTKA